MHAYSFPVVLNKFKVCPELMINKKGYDKNGLVTCTNNTICNCSVGTFTSSVVNFRQQMNVLQCNCKRKGSLTIIFIIAAVLWHCASSLQSRCTVLCKQSSIFIWAEDLTVEVMYVCTYACMLRKLRGGPLLYTYGM